MLLAPGAHSEVMRTSSASSSLPPMNGAAVACLRLLGDGPDVPDCRAIASAGNGGRRSAAGRSAAARSTSTTASPTARKLPGSCLELPEARAELPAPLSSRAAGPAACLRELGSLLDDCDGEAGRGILLPALEEWAELTMTSLVLLSTSSLVGKTPLNRHLRDGRPSGRSVSRPSGWSRSSWGSGSRSMGNLLAQSGAT